MTTSSQEWQPDLHEYRCGFLPATKIVLTFWRFAIHPSKAFALQIKTWTWKNVEEEEENVCEQTLLSRFWMLQHLAHVFTFSSPKLFRLTCRTNINHTIRGSTRLWENITNPSSTLSSSNEMYFILNNAAPRPILWIHLLSQETEWTVKNAPGRPTLNKWSKLPTTY